MDNGEPNFFILTTGNPIRALSIAINKAHRGEKNVQIAIICSDNYISDEELASIVCLKSYLMKTEYPFIYEIHATEIMHVVRLDTLISRGLYKKCRPLDPKTWIADHVEAALLPLDELRFEICENNENTYGRGLRCLVATSLLSRSVSVTNAPLRALASLIWERGTHFEPRNYWEYGLNWRIRDTVEQDLERYGHRCAYDRWYGELADDADEG